MNDLKFLAKLLLTIGLLVLAFNLAFYGNEKCKRCDGVGYVGYFYRMPCSTCNGKGKAMKYHWRHLKKNFNSKERFYGTLFSLLFIPKLWEDDKK